MAKSLRSRDHRAVMAVMQETRKKTVVFQAELARRIKQPQSVISKIESGEKRMDLPELFRLCRAMQVHPGAIVTEMFERAEGVRIPSEQGYNPEMPRSVDPVALLKTKLKRVSLRELARTIGCSPPYLSDVMNGKRDPGPLILRYLGLRKVVSVRWERV